MKSSILEIPAFDSETGRVNAVIETPGGTRNKYKYDTETGLFRFRKVLPLGAVYPFDFGFVPSTEGGDGDPLDILVLMEEPSFCGCLVAARLVGAIEAEQSSDGETERNDRLIGVAESHQTTENQQLYANVHSLEDLNRETLDQIEHFFISYNQFSGKEFRILRRSGPKAARELVERHITEKV